MQPFSESGLTWSRHSSRAFMSLFSQSRLSPEASAVLTSLTREWFCLLWNFVRMESYSVCSYTLTSFAVCPFCCVHWWFIPLCCEVVFPGMYMQQLYLFSYRWTFASLFWLLWVNKRLLWHFQMHLLNFLLGKIVGIELWGHRASLCMSLINYLEDW